MTRSFRTRALSHGVGAAALALALGACATGGAGQPGSTQSPDQDATADAHADGAGDTHSAGETPQATEAAAATPRIVLTYDGGLLVLDANSLETEADIALAGFSRLSDAGDGRHVAVSTTGAWALLDAGAWTQAHGDHAHHYTAAPMLTDLRIDAEEPGHVVIHDGLATLFDDGTGEVTVLDAGEWAHMVEHRRADVVHEYTAAEPHHGVAIATENGELLVTIGDDQGRTGAMLRDEDGAVLASSEECPGVHGETAFTNAAGEELLMVGCEDGTLAFHGDHVHKTASPDAFGRIGNLFSADGSDAVLGDYKTDPEGGIGLARVALIDTAAEAVTVVDPFAGEDVRYTWRGLARGADGEALVLGTDGALRVLDAATGEVRRTVDVIEAWDVPDEWQTAHPALTVLAGMAYVTEPATGTVHIVDYVGGEVWRSVDVGVEMIEMAGVEG